MKLFLELWLKIKNWFLRSSRGKLARTLFDMIYQQTDMLIDVSGSLAYAFQINKLNLKIQYLSTQHGVARKIFLNTNGVDIMVFEDSSYDKLFIDGPWLDKLHKYVMSIND